VRGQALDRYHTYLPEGLASIREKKKLQGWRETPPQAKKHKDKISHLWVARNNPWSERLREKEKDYQGEDRRLSNWDTLEVSAFWRYKESVTLGRGETYRSKAAAGEGGGDPQRWSLRRISLNVYQRTTKKKKSVLFSNQDQQRKEKDSGPGDGKATRKRRSARKKKMTRDRS